jgi:hypothetical protein
MGAHAQSASFLPLPLVTPVVAAVARLRRLDRPLRRLDVERRAGACRRRNTRSESFVTRMYRQSVRFRGFHERYAASSGLPGRSP